MTARRPNLYAVEAGRLIADHYAYVVQAAIDHLVNERRNLDWHPTSTLGDGTPRGSSDSSSVERVVAQLRHYDTLIAQLYDDIDTIRSVAASALTVANRALGDRAPKPTPVRCDATGREGAIEWGRPDCGDLPVRGTLCMACWWREYRYRKAKGLGGRDDGFAA